METQAPVTFATAVRILQSIADRIPRAHAWAWWPGHGIPLESRIHANTTKQPGPMLQPGDHPTMGRYRTLLGDLMNLEAHVRHVQPRFPTFSTLHPKTPPHQIVARILAVSRVLDASRAHPDEVADLTKAASAIDTALDEILSDPRQRGDILKCRNPAKRDFCTGIASNRKQRLCRSCENAGDYRRNGAHRRERRRSTGRT